MIVLAWVFCVLYLMICYSVVAIPMFGGLRETKNPYWITGELPWRLIMWLLAPIVVPIFLIYLWLGGPITPA